MARLLTALVLCLSTAALADLTMVSESTSQGKVRTVTLSAKGGKAYFEMKEADGPTRVMLRDADAKKMFLIDHPKKTVVVVTEEDSKGLEEKQAQLRAQMQAQLAKMPPEQRARIESTMLGTMGGEAKPPDFTYEKKKSGTRKLNGFTCQDYAMKRDGKAWGEGCFITWKDAGFTADEFKATMLRAMPTMGGAGPMGNAFEANAHAPGFPVWRTVVDAQGVVTIETTVKSLSKTSMPAENFEVPKDYTERAMTDVMKGQRPVK